MAPAAATSLGSSDLQALQLDVLQRSAMKAQKYLLAVHLDEELAQALGEHDLVVMPVDLDEILHALPLLEERPAALAYALVMARERSLQPRRVSPLPASARSAAR